MEQKVFRKEKIAYFPGKRKRRRVSIRTTYGVMETRPRRNTQRRETVAGIHVPLQLVGFVLRAQEADETGKGSHA